MCAIHQSLKPVQRKALRSMLRAKRLMQHDVARWLELQQASRAKESSEEDKDAARQAQARISAALSSRLPDKAKVKEVWEQSTPHAERAAHDDATPSPPTRAARLRLAPRSAMALTTRVCRARRAASRRVQGSQGLPAAERARLVWLGSE